MRFSGISAIICIAAVSLIGAGLVAFSRTIPEDVEGAAAVALKSHVEFELLEIIAKRAKPESTSKVQFCVDSEVALDFDELGKHFEQNGLEPVDTAMCHQICGDDGYWKIATRNNEDAFKFHIYEVSCSFWQECVIGISLDSSGAKYRVEKSSGGWRVTDESETWIAHWHTFCGRSVQRDTVLID